MPQTIDWALNMIQSSGYSGSIDGDDVYISDAKGDIRVTEWTPSMLQQWLEQAEKEKNNKDVEKGEVTNNDPFAPPAPDWL